MMIDPSEKCKSPQCHRFVVAGGAGFCQEHAPEPVHNPVDHPAHYTQGKVECIDALESATLGLTGEECGLTWSAMKYLWRWKRKNGKQDLEKARWYIDRLIGKLNAPR